MAMGDAVPVLRRIPQLLRLHQSGWGGIWAVSKVPKSSWATWCVCSRSKRVLGTISRYFTTSRGRAKREY